MAGRAARASTTIPPIRPRCSPSASDTRHTQPSPPKDPHAWLRLAPFSRGGERPARRTAIRDGALRPRRLGHEARFAQIGGWVAVLAGLQAEDVIEHGDAIHELMETHETVALTTMGIFTVVLGWKLFRRSKLTSAEEAGLRVLSVAGLVAIIWTGVLGSKLMFEHAAGIPNATLQAEIENREAGHHHEAGEAEEQQHAAPADTAKAAAHTHAPGTPPHKH